MYTHVSAGGGHTVLLRSDGCAVACGVNNYGQCRVPSLKSWRQWLSFSSPSLRYISDLKPLERKPERVLQLFLNREADAIVVCFCLDWKCCAFQGRAKLAAEVSSLRCRLCRRSVCHTCDPLFEA